MMRVQTGQPLPKPAKKGTIIIEMFSVFKKKAFELEYIDPIYNLIPF